MLDRKSHISVIGAGKVAHTIIPLLVKKGYSVKGVISRTIKPARALAKKFKLEFSSDDINTIPPDVKVFLIMVPDNQITAAAEQLSKLSIDFRRCLFVHTSGSEGSSALNELEKKGGLTASFHIMQTFPSIKKTDIKNSFAAIETKYGQAERYLFSLARTLDLKSFKLTEEEKVYYHMAGVFAANFINANFYSSEKLLEKTGLRSEDHYFLFEPIIKRTLLNIKENGSAASLSGPVQRGDSQTVQRHINALRKLKPGKRKMLMQSYIDQSMLLLEIIKERKGELNKGQKEIKRILAAAIK